MNERKSWVGHHDFANYGDIRREHRHNEAMLEAKFYGDLNQFRVKATQKLAEHEALSDSGGVAIFSQDGTCAEEHSNTVNTLLSLAPSKHDASELAPPKIRIIKNELIVNESSGQVFTVDFAADEEDDVQYLVDAYDPDQAASSELGASHTLAPVFIIEEGEIKITPNYNTFTPVLQINGAGMGLEEVKVMPFGSYLYLEDKIHALSIGERLLDDLANTAPVHVKPS